jgi:iron complex outermembrane receptor protein
MGTDRRGRRMTPAANATSKLADGRHAGEVVEMAKSAARVSATTLLCAASWTGLIAAGAAPFATAAEAGDVARERIVVTARRREESILELPASVSAYTYEDLVSAGITTARDYIALTPNVTLVETQNAGTAFVTIRGITQARNSEPSVAVIIDGVQQTNPSQFTQELVDIQQIEVIRGPQGAIYGRNAIGGAINITTRGPTDVWESTFKGGWESGDGYTLSARASGPLGGNAGFAGGVSWKDIDGYLDNEFLNEKADPVELLAARGRLVFEPTDNLTIDLRGTVDQFRGRSLFFVIDQSIVFAGTNAFDVNDTSIPITVNNRGQNDRDIYGASAQIQFESDAGTFTSTTSWDSLEEILTGDQFDFKPRDLSFFFLAPPAFGGLGTDLNQSQFLDVENVSQEFRFVSPSDRRVRYVLGAYGVTTDRFISTGNMVDTGAGVFPVFRTPSTNAANPQATFLADAQDNTAWAVFGDVTIDLNDRWELSLAGRYDEDEREQTTLTPDVWLTALPNASFGEVRTETFDEFQPKVTLRYSPTDDLTLYGGYSRGFRSGGFNQSGVRDAAENNPAGLGGPILGVGDIFLPEIADTYEVGFKSELLDGMLSLNGAAFHTVTENSYFFVFLATNSTQNLGNINEVEITGFELDGVAQLSDALSVNFGLGFTDGEITAHAAAAAVGNTPPLVSDYTANLGVQYLAPLGGSGLDLRVRTDLQRIGDTYWEPFNTTVRDPVDLVDLRIGVEGDNWALTAWSKNLFDEDYNAEFSPGGFLFKALPQRYGVELSRSF